MAVPPAGAGAADDVDVTRSDPESAFVPRHERPTRPIYEWRGDPLSALIPPAGLASGATFVPTVPAGAPACVLCAEPTSPVLGGWWCERCELAS